MMFIQLNIIQSKVFLFIFFSSLQLMYFKNRNNNVVTVGVINKSEIPNKVVLDFLKDNSIKLSSKKNKIEKVIEFPI